MIYEEETARLRRGLFDVQNEVGLGRHEEIYHQAMALWLTKENISYVSKKPHSLSLYGETAYTLYPDLVVWDKITIEMKSIIRGLQDSDHVQLFNYLKRRKDKLGLLVNMGLDRVDAERIVYDAPDYEQLEDWHYWNKHISGEERKIGFLIRTVLQELYSTHKTGYGTEVLEKLIMFGLQKNGLKATCSPSGTSNFQGHVLGKSPFDCLLIENKVILVFTALFDSTRFNINRGKSFMKALGTPWGIAANFGKKTFEIEGLSI